MASPSRPAPETVLIVDDDALVRRMLSDMVSSAGFQPLEADSAEQARVLVPERPRVAFIDLTLPEQSGDQFCRDLRLDEETWDMPIVMVTGVDDAQAVRRCLVAGADDFILKPVHPTEMRAKLEAVRGGGEPALQRKLTNKRVLLATKQPFFVSNVSRLLRASGCEVVLADSQAAVDAACEGSKLRPDVAVLDFDLLGHNAVEATRRHEVPGLTPPLLLGVASTPTIQWLAARTGASSRFSKSLVPFDIEEDRDEILRHLNRALTLGLPKKGTQRNPRVPFYSTVRFRSRGEEAWSHGIGLDLSESGIFVRTVAPLRPSSRAVELSFRVGDRGESVTACGVVAWANGYGARHLSTFPFGMGISLTEISETSIERIRDYVKARIVPLGA